MDASRCRRYGPAGVLVSSSEPGRGHHVATTSSHVANRGRDVRVMVAGRPRRWSSVAVAVVVTVCTTIAHGGPAEAGTHGTVSAEPTVLAPGGTSTVRVIWEVHEGVLPTGLRFELTPVFEAVGSMEFIAINVVSGPITCDTPLPSVTTSCVWANATIGEIVTVDAIVAASSDANGSWFISTAYLDEAGGGGYGFNIHAVPPTPPSTSSTTHSSAATNPGPIDARDPTGTGVDARGSSATGDPLTSGSATLVS